jgi:T5orf172 domain
MKAGYLYVLVHPSDPDLYKIGVTILHPKARLAQHNRQYQEHAGRIVKETGQKWELKTFITVPDPYWSELAFWAATGLAELPYQAGIEVQKMSWESVQVGLDAASKAGVRAPKPVPNWVHANAIWMNKRLEGRGLTLLGNVRSKFGKSNFQCSNGHHWRAVPTDVVEGEGCPRCGIGKRDPEEVRRSARPAILCLLVHPDKPGLIKIGLTYSDQERCHEENDWGGWEMHRYRRVEEPALAEALIWELLGCPLYSNREPIRIDLRRAEQAFRELVPRLIHELALVGKQRHEARQND